MSRTKAQPKTPQDWPTEARKAGYEAAAFAKRIGMTGGELEGVIREHFKVTAEDYLRALQINFAVDRLNAGDSVSEAAAKSRFATRQQFSREFKRLVGVSPREFLQRKS